MNRNLILYATREGQTEKVANQIAVHLRNAGADVRVLNANDSVSTTIIDFDAFDQLVFGASMHAGGIENELITFINGHKEEIEQKQRALFLVLLSAATKDPELKNQWLTDARMKLDEQLNVQFDDVEMIAGALTYSKYALPLKWMMRRIARKAGEDTDTSQDYEYTDWKQVERYAAALVGTTYADS